MEGVASKSQSLIPLPYPLTPGEGEIITTRAGFSYAIFLRNFEFVSTPGEGNNFVTRPGNLHTIKNCYEEFTNYDNRLSHVEQDVWHVLNLLG